MRTASAKPAPSLKETIRDIHALTNIAYKRKALIAPEAIEPFLKVLEAQPAAERKALENLRDSIEAMRQEARRDLRNPPDDGVSKNFDIAFFGGKSLGLLRARQEVDKLLSGGSQR